MGCVQAKHSSTSPHRSIESLKLEKGYVKGHNGGKPVGQKQILEELVKVSKHGIDHSASARSISVNGGNVRGGDGGDRSVLSKDGRKERNNGSVSQRIVSKKITDDEYIDGWPKWLVDNVPRGTLDGLKKKTADSYDKIAKVGHGTYSNVYKAFDKEARKIVALKKVRFDTSEPESVKFMAREIMMLKLLDHPNIIKLEGIVTSRMQYSLYLVFEFMQTDLTKLIFRRNGKLTLPQVKFYMGQLLSGLSHCHERGILHRDIKGSNLLIAENGELKIADFGLANYSNPEPKKPMTSRVVTLWYRAPELFLGSTDYGVGIDLWSAGCVLAEMLLGRPIMAGRTEVEQLHKIYKLCGTPTDEYWKKMKLPTSFKPYTSYEPSFKKAFPDFPPAAIKLLSSLLAVDPVLRGSATSALQSDFFISSPLACDVSGLPVIAKAKDEPTQTNDRRNPKKKPIFPINNGGSMAKDLSADHKQEHESVKELEQTVVINLQDGPETSSTSSSSSVNATSRPGSLPPSPTSYRFALQNKSFRTDINGGHIKNVVNFPEDSSNTDFAGPNDRKMPRFNRSFSTLDFRAFSSESSNNK